MKQKLLRSKIGARTRVAGELQFVNTLLICGQFSGSINGGKALIIDKGARVEGEIEVDTLIARGHVQGRVVARDSIIIEDSGVVNADIQTKHIHIATNAQYEGRCVTSEK